MGCQSNLPSRSPPWPKSLPQIALASTCPSQSKQRLVSLLSWLLLLLTCLATSFWSCNQTTYVSCLSWSQLPSHQRWKRRGKCSSLVFFRMSPPLFYHVTVRAGILLLRVPVSTHLVSLRRVEFGLSGHVRQHFQRIRRLNSDRKRRLELYR